MGTAEVKLVIMALGPSLTQDDIDYVAASPCKVMVINELFRKCKWADYMYAADRPWWEVYGAKVKKQFHGKPVTIWPDIAEEQGALCFEGHDREDGRGGLHTEAGHIYNGSTSAHAALNVAYHLGYKEIALLGYDCKPGHFLQQAERPEELWRNSPYGAFAMRIQDIIVDLEEKGVTVHQCSPDSAIEWPYTPLEEIV